MEPNWKPLEMRLGKKRCAGFMFMGRVNGVNPYKHGIARRYLYIDDFGQCYTARGNWRFERADSDAGLDKLEALARELEETLESVYDEAYIARKRKALEMTASRSNESKSSKGYTDFSLPSRTLRLTCRSRATGIAGKVGGAFQGPGKRA